jgi:hypothetical protein
MKTWVFYFVRNTLRLFGSSCMPRLSFASWAGAASTVASIQVICLMVAEWDCHVMGAKRGRSPTPFARQFLAPKPQQTAQHTRLLFFPRRRLINPKQWKTTTTKHTSR